MRGVFQCILVRNLLSVRLQVICLEEVDHFDDFFQPALAALGYEGVFEAKTKSPSLQFGSAKSCLEHFGDFEVFSAL